MTSLGLFKYGIPAPVAAAVLTGSLVDGLNDSNVRMGYGTIIITLSVATWVASGATFDAQRQNIIDGVTGSTAWNTNVRDNISVGNVVRTSDSVVTITLSDIYIGYAPTSDDSISVTVPASATSDASAIAATPGITVTRLTGTPTDYVSTVFNLQTLLGRSNIRSAQADMGTVAAREALQANPGLVYFPTTAGLIEDFSFAGFSSGWHLGYGAGSITSSVYTLFITTGSPNTYAQIRVSVGDNHPTTSGTYWADEGCAVNDPFGMDEGP